MSGPSLAWTMAELQKTALRVKAERDELLAALEMVVRKDAEAGEMIFSATDYEQIDAAIKKAKGE